MRETTETYVGKVCKKHPALKGERYMSARSCCGCANSHSSRWKKNNPHHARYGKYGITRFQFIEMLLEQEGKCCICASSNPGKNGWHVDHDHETKVVRGLLCGVCNIGLGMFKDNIYFLQSAINYLTKHKT